MTIEIIDEGPHPKVVKEVVCLNCGVTLRYTPMDVQQREHKDYGGGSDTYYWIGCPKCAHRIEVKRPI